MKEQVTKGARHAFGVGGHVSRTVQEIQRSLLTVDECLRMPEPVKGFKNGRDVIEEARDIYVAGFRLFMASSRSISRMPSSRQERKFPHLPLATEPFEHGGSCKGTESGWTLDRYLAPGFLILGFICFAAGMRVNTTKSIPMGLYQIVDEPVEKGAHVIFCPPRLDVFDEAKERGYIAAGFCPGDYGLMMKRVLASENDRVVLTESGVRINGELVPSSSRFASDKEGRAMPRYQFNDYTLGKGELLLMSDGSATSFDGRYFGPVDGPQVQGVIEPLITF